jgi:hypothetical protein
MYVSNTTKQNVSFLYRVPESSGVRNQEIPVGSQVALSGDLSREAIDYIIDQHAKYGMVEVSEIDRIKEFSGLCYSIDKPVPVGKIERLIHHNTGKLIELGKKIRQEAAMSGNSVLENDLDESGRPERLRNFEMSIVEENHDDRDETPAIAEGVRVSRGADAPAPQTSRRRR